MSSDRFTTTTYIAERSWFWPAGALLLVAAALFATTQRTAAATAWKVSCPAKTACVAHLDRKGVQILVGRTQAKAPLRMAFRVSAAARTGKPVALRLNDGWQAGLRIGKCSKAYCEVGVAQKATSTAVAALARNRSGLVAYEIKNRILLIEFPLDGFRDAMKRVEP